MADTLLSTFDRLYQEQLTQRVHDLIQRAECHCNRTFTVPDISFTLKGANAGLALLTKNAIRFNARMLNEYGERFIEQIAAHELAHLIAYQLYGPGIKPHGTEWQSIMRDIFHCEPAVTHRFATKMYRRKVYLYSCTCDQLIEFSSTRHKRARSGITYRCKRCKSALSYTSGRRKKNTTGQPTQPKQRELPLYS